MINAQEAMRWLVEHSPRTLALHRQAVECQTLDLEQLREITAEEAQALSLTLDYHHPKLTVMRQVRDEFVRHDVQEPYELQLRTNRYQYRDSHSRALPELIADVESGKLTEAKLLSYLAAGQDINVHGTQEESLLGYAAARGHVGVVELLLKHKADVNLQLAHSQDYRYGTPLDDALEAQERVPGLTEACGLLAEHGARLDVYQAYGYPSMYYLLGCVKQPEALVRVLDATTRRDPVYAKFVANLPSGLLPLHNLLRSRNQGQAAAEVAAALIRMGAEPLVERFGTDCCTGLRAGIHEEARTVLRQSVLEVVLATGVVRPSPVLWAGIMRIVVEMLIDFTEPIEQPRSASSSASSASSPVTSASRYVPPGPPLRGRGGKRT